MNYLKYFENFKNITRLSFWYPSEQHKDGGHEAKTLSKNKKIKVNDESVPIGYVNLYFEGVTLDDLYRYYGLTFTYVKVLDNYYVNTMHILKSNIIFDCHNDGLNECVTIHKESDVKLNIIVTDINDKLEIKQIINGQLIS